MLDSSAFIFVKSLYVKLTPLPVEPIPIPAPLNKLFVVTVVAIPTTKSASSIVVELICVVVPSTYKSPLILTEPVLSPIAVGSIISSDGPVI
jgi:hypothetical protein